MDDDNGEVNPYRELVVNNAEKIEMQKTQMEQWSILSNSLSYVQHSKFNSISHSLNIKPVNKCKMKLNDSFSSSEKEFREVDFGANSQNLQAEYLDVYEGVQSDIVSSSRFNENSDISMTYLGKIGQEESQNKLKAEESFPISENGYTLEDYWMVRSVNYYLTQVLVNPLCQNHSTCTVSHYIPYRNLLLLHREYK